MGHLTIFFAFHFTLLTCMAKSVEFTTNEMPWIKKEVNHGGNDRINMLLENPYIASFLYDAKKKLKEKRNQRLEPPKFGKKELDQIYQAYHPTATKSFADHYKELQIFQREMQLPPKIGKETFSDVAIQGGTLNLPKLKKRMQKFLGMEMEHLLPPRIGRDIPATEHASFEKLSSFKRSHGDFADRGKMLPPRVGRRIYKFPPRIGRTPYKLSPMVSRMSAYLPTSIGRKAIYLPPRKGSAEDKLPSRIGHIASSLHQRIGSSKASLGKSKGRTSLLLFPRRRRTSLSPNLIIFLLSGFPDITLPQPPKIGRGTSPQKHSSSYAIMEAGSK